jgi:hypothetical protein
MRPRAWSFRLVLEAAAEMTEGMAEALYGAGCGDATLGQQFGEVFLDFDREAPSLDEAVRGAVMDVESAGFKVTRILVDVREVSSRVESKSLGIPWEGRLRRPVLLP